MKASEVMSSPVIAVRPEAPLREVARTLAERRISAVPVVDRGRLVGIVSEADVLRAAPAGGRLARDVMTSEVLTVGAETPLEEVAALLAARGIRRVPVVERDRVVGIVSRANLVHALAVKPLAGGARNEDEPAARVALLERLGGEPWWRGGESLREAPPSGPTYGVRRAADRGHSRQGWAETCYSFSFGDFYDPAYLAFGPLQALNEKVVQPGLGSATYGVRDVEIVTWVIDGELRHESSLDDAHVLSAGGVQALSAGSGARFSEVNPGHRPVRFLQLWLEPDRCGLPAASSHAHIAAGARLGRLQLVVAPGGRDGALPIRQDALLYCGSFDGAQSARLDIGAGRLGYVQVARGSLVACGETLRAGDGLAVPGGSAIALEGASDAEVLVLDLAFATG